MCMYVKVINVVASFYYFFRRSVVVLRLSNSIWILNVPKRAFIVRQTAHGGSLSPLYRERREGNRMGC